MKLNILNIKKLSGLLMAGALVVGVASCSDDFLQTDNPNQPSSTTFWKTAEDADMGLTACYDAMQNMNLYNDHLDNWNFGIFTRETCTDNGDHTWGNWQLGSSIAECTSGTKDECFSMYWNANYEWIKRLNLFIENVGRCDISESQTAAYIAEAKALRALAYCNLTSVFRDVPFLTKPLTLSEAQAPKVDRETIVTTLIDELKACLPDMPAKGQARIGHLSREGGYAILGRLALFNKKYDEAIDAYSKVYGKYRLFTSGDGSDKAANFHDLFTTPNETDEEVLLGVHFVGPAQGEGQTFGICWKAPMNAIEASMNLSDEFYCTDGLPITESPLFTGAPNTDPRRYDNRDPRLKGTIFVPGMTWNGKYYADVTAKSKCHIMKFYIPENTSHEYDGSQDFYVIRYAEVLLSYAEALIEKGGNDQLAMKLIDEVRARVGMPSVEKAECKNGTKTLTQAELRAVVRHERRVELAFEDLRFADLYRWDDFQGAQKRMQHDRVAYGAGVLNHADIRGPQDKVWPIPQGEIDTNPMLEQHAEWK